MERLRAHRETLLFVSSTLLLLIGGGMWLVGRGSAAAVIWIVGTSLGLVASLAWTVAAIKDRRFGVDLIAVLALAGSLAVNEPLAGALITVMLASGRLLEARAEGRAKRELALLVERSPKIAYRQQSGAVEAVPVADVKPGDRLLVRTGDIVPVDGRLLGDGLLDESALTGEPLPIERHAGEDIRSGVVNAGAPLDLVATARATDSTYAGVVRLAEQAQTASAPFVRSADRLATLFVPLTLIVAAAAWALTADPVRAVAVLVVATPCPLLLAVPIAFMSGLSRSARVGVVVKGGSALERLAAARVMLFDKTGTLTVGKPVLTDIVLAGDDVDSDELLRLAASLDQVSPHIVASAIVTAARRRGLVLELPDDVEECHGYGVRGQVAGREVKLGKRSWVVPGDPPAWARQASRRADLDGSLIVFAAIDARPAGALLLEDMIRPDAPKMIRSLREAGIGKIELVTGDRADIADSVGRIVGVDTVLADCDPAAKLAAVRSEAAHAATVMVGDGLNDAPALAAAGVGVALASRGATASSEAADVVLTVDRVDALAKAIQIAQRSKRIAMQAALTGMGLSLVAMVAAAAGLLPPAAGAVLQELIDLLAIGVALRAVLPGRTGTSVIAQPDVAVARQLKVQHDATRTVVEQIRRTADALSMPDARLEPVRTLLHRLESELLPHERADESLLVPIMARAMGGPEATTAITRTHAEIEHQIGRLRRLVDGLADDTARPEDVIELRRLLYGLYAIMRLHNAQEDETAFSLLPD